MSQILNLAKDYSRFVIEFFDLISTSASHIYISALPLSPRTSMVCKIYMQYAHPLARVVYGLPTSWEPIVATTYYNSTGDAAAWSSCNRFIAISRSGMVEICDAATLNPLTTFISPLSTTTYWLSFSSDNHLLTQFNDENFITWDLQTGGSVCTPFPKGLHVNHMNFSSVYSIDGKMLAVVYSDQESENTFIVTHNFFSTSTHLYQVSGIIPPIWTHGEFLQFATVKSGCITIWEVRFTLSHTPKVIKSFPAPDEMANTEFFQRALFLPMLFRLAISLGDKLLVWDACDSRLLLKISTFSGFEMSFSSDGHLFAYILMSTREVHVWKEHPTGYILHQKLMFTTLFTAPLLSPNGESIVVSLPLTIHLWHTKDPILCGSTQGIDWGNFQLRFSPNEELAAFVCNQKDTVTILDLQSGTQLTIDTGVGIRSLGVTGTTIVAVGREKVVTLNLAAGNTRVKINDSIQTMTLDLSPPSQFIHGFRDVSIHPELTHVIISGTHPVSGDRGMEIYDVSSGRRITTTLVAGLQPRLRFTPDGHEIWDIDPQRPCEQGWEIIRDGESEVTKLRPLKTTACPPEVFPWWSSHGYEVTEDWWVVNPTQKRLLWLPHRWRSDGLFRTWSGRFLGLQHPWLPDVVIFELFE